MCRKKDRLPAGAAGKGRHMEYKTFKEEFKQRIEKELGGGITASFLDVEKNNQERYEGLEIKDENNPVLPILRLEELYEGYKGSGSMEQMVSVALGELGRYSEVSVDMVPKTWEEARGRLRSELVHYGWNLESLKNIPHRRFLDFAVAYRVELPVQGEFVGGIRVNSVLMGLWGITERELYETAMENLKNEDYRIQPMSELLGSIFGIMPGMLGGIFGITPELMEDMPKQYVLTNEGNRYGAAGLLRKDILESFAEQSGGNFYILPSSIHELILLPEDFTVNAECLKEMVKEVNQEAVIREEWLSESVYYYDFKEGTLRVA